jgi:hypothetical protein
MARRIPKKRIKKSGPKRRVRAAPKAHDFVDRSLLPPQFKGVCNLPRVCRYLDDLNAYLQGDFYQDYKRLRIAVCNVEKQAFSTSGTNAQPPKFCKGGGGNEPADPPEPPDWD